MSENLNTFSVSIPIDSTTAATVPIWKCSAEGGGVTLMHAYLMGVGTATTQLVTMSNIGTPAVNGTLVTSAAGTVSAGVPKEFTLGTAFVEGGLWVGWVMTAGTLLAGSYLQLIGVHGK